MERVFRNIVWEDGNKKDRIYVTIDVTSENGEVVTQQAAITQDSPDWEEAFKFTTVEELDSKFDLQKQKRKEREEKQKEQEKSNIERMKQEALFEVKLEIFEIELIKASKNRKLKAAIRKAKSQTEALVYASAVVSDQLKVQEAAEVETEASTKPKKTTKKKAEATEE